MPRASPRCSRATSTGSIRSRCRTSQRINASANAQVLQGPELRTIFLGFDQYRDELKYSNVKGKNPFKDVRVRKAFYLAIDEQAIADKVMRGAAMPSALMISPLLFPLVEGLQAPGRCAGRGQEAAGRGRLSERLRGDDGLPERPLRQ